NIKDESTAHANINGQNIKFPAQLELALRVFRGSKAYKFNAHLRHRVRKEGLLFWYTIPDIEAVKENAFAHVIAQVEEACEKTVYRGTYGSRYADQLVPDLECRRAWRRHFSGVGSSRLNLSAWW